MMRITMLTNLERCESIRNDNFFIYKIYFKRIVVLNNHFFDFFQIFKSLDIIL